MDMKKFEINGATFTFICSGRSTAHGFAHDCSLFIEDQPGAAAGKYTASVHWLNRTWETYKFQTVQRYAVYKAIDERKKALLFWFKAEHGYKRMTKNRQNRFEAAAAADTILNAYLAALDRLDHLKA